MGAFWNKDNDEKKKDAAKEKKQNIVADAKKEDKKSEKKDKKKKKVSADLKKKSDLVNSIILKPTISERAMNQQMMGKYVFEVSQKANKKTVAEAVEALYGVDVLGVNLMNYKQKNKSFRNYRGKQKAVKNAIVSIKEGQEIKLFNE